MSNTRIARPDKNQMRACLEEVLQLQKDLVKKLELYEQAIEVPEYQEFWRDLSKCHNELNRKVYNYMVRKCNR